jgi:hypothetical protein
LGVAPVESSHWRRLICDAAPRSAEQMKIVIEAESPGDSGTLFRIRFGEKLIGEELTAAETHLLIGEILERITLPRKNDAAVK